MTDMTEASEQQRREVAYEHRGEVVEDSAEAVEPRRLDQVVTVRLDPDQLQSLRQVAEEKGLTLSEALREAAAGWVASESASREVRMGQIRVHFAAQASDYIVRTGVTGSGTSAATPRLSRAAG